MNLGEKVKTTVGELTLDDRVFPDRSCFQYEAGWWAFDENEVEYFVSDEGIVYREAERTPEQLQAFDVPAGRVT